MSSDDAIPVRIQGLIPTPSGSGVFLNHEDKTIAIFVDPSVAAAISMFMQNVTKPRPLTHDLMGNIFQGLGIQVQKVVVNDLKDDTFYARLFLIQSTELGTNLAEIDSRPSDAIALALQAGCPIFVNATVWAKAEDMNWALAKAREEAEGSSSAQSEIDIDKAFENDIETLLKELEEESDDDDIPL